MTTAQTIEALRAELVSIRAEVDEIKATACRCSSCQDRAHGRQEQRDRARAATIEAMPVADRVQTLTMMDFVERDRIARYLVDKIQIAIETPADRRADLMRAMHMEQIERDQVRAHFVTSLPDLVRVEYASERHKWERSGPVKERRLHVSDADAKRLTAAGIVVKDGGTHRVYFRPELVVSWPELPRERWEAMLACDPELAAFVSDGIVIATPLSDDEKRSALIRKWDDEREHRQHTHETAASIRAGYQGA